MFVDAEHLEDSLKFIYYFVCIFKKSYNLGRKALSVTNQHEETSLTMQKLTGKRFITCLFEILRSMVLMCFSLDMSLNSIMQVFFFPSCKFRSKMKPAKSRHWKLD